MRRPQGYLIQFDGNDPDIERDTVTCGHCGHVDIIPPGMQPGDQCRSCMRFLCEICYRWLAAGNPCTPHEKRLDLYEKGKLPGSVLR